MHTNKTLNTIVVGGLNTDIIAFGTNKIIAAGEHTYGEKLQIGPGGKSRNMAQMIATLLGKNKVAMIGKSSKDPHGLWKIPIDALKKAGVNVENVIIESFAKTKQYPGIALIAVDKAGRNQIYVLPGITNNFLPKDIDKAEETFQSVKKNKGCLVISLELPLETAIYAIAMANKLDIKVLFDPGGIDENQSYADLLKEKIYLIKPNEHEIKILTGITVSDFNSAKKAAQRLQKQGVENVFITMGEKGGYLFTNTLAMHIAIPKIKSSAANDETGCGDQTMAALTAAFNNGKNIVEAARIGIHAGTLQFGREGIVPVTRQELAEFCPFEETINF